MAMVLGPFAAADYVEEAAAETRHGEDAAGFHQEQSAAEVNGEIRPVFVKNTFLDVDECEKPTLRRTHSAPKLSCTPHQDEGAVEQTRDAHETARFSLADAEPAGKASRDLPLPPTRAPTLPFMQSSSPPPPPRHSPRHSPGRAIVVGVIDGELRWDFAPKKICKGCHKIPLKGQGRFGRMVWLKICKHHIWSSCWHSEDCPFDHRDKAELDELLHIVDEGLAVKRDERVIFPGYCNDIAAVDLL